MKKLLQLLATFTAITAIIISCSKEEPTPEPIKYTLTVSAGTGGSVSTTGGSYEAGASVSVTATPNTEYEFTGWSNGSTDNPLSVTVNSNTTITANFAKVKYAMNVTIEGEGTVTEEVVSTGKDYDSGTVVQYTAVPAEGWVFSNWSGAEDSIVSSITLTADASKSINATFIEIPFETASVGEGTIETELVYNESNEATALKLTAVTPAGWRFDGWTGGVESTEMEVEVALDLAEAVTATFIQVYDLTVTIEGEGEVTEEIVVDEASKTYDSGTNVKLTAVPAEGYIFIKWAGVISSTENPVIISIDSQKAVTATFEENPIYLDDNGVTIKAQEFSSVGDKGYLDGVEYTVVDREMIQNLLSSGGDLTKVVTSKITSMKEVFKDRPFFNQNISSWDTSNVTNMEGMFVGCTAFNQEIGYWDVSSVTNMKSLFDGAESFNGNIENWDVSSVLDMYFLFKNARSYNQPIGNWDTSNVTNMGGMFQNARSFDQPIGDWDTSNVTMMAGMFEVAFNFNQDISDWDVSKVTWFMRMFRLAKKFNQPIGKWNMSSATSINEMFEEAISFNQDLNDWDVSNVGTEDPYDEIYWLGSMREVFRGATSFNGIISSWDVRNVSNMLEMFAYATSFNQDLSNWCTPNIITNRNFSFDSALEDSNLPIWGTCPD